MLNFINAKRPKQPHKGTCFELCSWISWKTYVAELLDLKEIDLIIATTQFKYRKINWRN